jgi:flagellar assembly protein FliH
MTAAGELQKYLFDRHNFDVGAIDPDHPPAPTFSEEDLAAAKATAFAEGHRQGLQDAQASRDQQLIEMTKKIATDLSILIKGEQIRNQQFETETLALAGTAYQKTFPLLNATFGLPQILATIKTTLTNLNRAPAVQIEVAPQDLDELSDRLKSFLNQHDTHITLITGSDLETGAFRMKWQDGGASRDPHHIAAQILTALGHTLAEPPQNPHTST